MRDQVCLKEGVERPNKCEGEINGQVGLEEGSEKPHSCAGERGGVR